MLGLIGGLLAQQVFASQEKEVDTPLALRVPSSEQHLLEHLRQLRLAKALVEDSSPEPTPTPTASSPVLVPPLSTPTPAPPPAPPTPVYPYHELICSYDWECATALAVVCDESGFNPTAVSWVGARGLMQLMPVHAWRFTRQGWDYWTDVFVPERNVAIGYELWVDQGWTPWDSSWPWTC